MAQDEPGTSVGLFIPLPDALASQFPSLGEEDASPPHVTLLYVGAVTRRQEQLFLSTVRGVLSTVPAPIRARLTGLDRFVHPEKGQVVYHSTVTFSRDVASVREALRLAIENVGIVVEDDHPLAYAPHVTLGYLPIEGGVVPPWAGPVPVGTWDFEDVEVWGATQHYVVDLRGAGQMAFSAFRIASAWLRNERLG